MSDAAEPSLTTLMRGRYEPPGGTPSAARSGRLFALADYKLILAPGIPTDAGVGGGDPPPYTSRTFSRSPAFTDILSLTCSRTPRRRPDREGDLASLPTHAILRAIRRPVRLRDGRDGILRAILSMKHEPGGHGAGGAFQQ